MTVSLGNSLDQDLARQRIRADPACRIQTVSHSDDIPERFSENIIFFKLSADIEKNPESYTTCKELMFRPNSFQLCQKLIKLYIWQILFTLNFAKKLLCEKNYHIFKWCL